MRTSQDHPRPIDGRRGRIVYALHSGQMLGTERMAVATLCALRGADSDPPILIAPPGPIHEFAAWRGIETRAVANERDWRRTWRQILGEAHVEAIFTTRTRDALRVQARLRSRTESLAHIHVVHGGASTAAASYARKRLVARSGATLVAVSGFVASELVRHGCPRDAIHVVPNFLDRRDAAVLRALASCMHARLRQGHLQRIAVVGRLDRSKRVDLVLEAVGLHECLRSQIEVVVAGDGPERAALQAEAEALGVKVSFLGSVPGAAEVLDCVDAFVHPAPEEPFGLAVLEAMTIGLPVVVSDRGGPAELVRDGRDGLTHRAGDARDLARRLLELFGMVGAQRAAMGRAACERARSIRHADGGGREYRRLVDARRPPVVEIGPLSVSRLGFDDTVSLIGSWLNGNRCRQVATANLDFLRLAALDADLKHALRSADLVTADGAPLVWLSRFRRSPITERVAGSDLLLPLVAEAHRSGRSVFLLGGSDGVGRRAAHRLQQLHPGLRIAGVLSPRIDLRDEDQCRSIARSIAHSGADLLLVALGCPKQDLFLARWLDTTRARVGIGVGASLDFLVGEVRRAPRSWQRVGVEWLWRLLQEPRRLAGRYARDLGFGGRLSMRMAWDAVRDRIGLLSEMRRVALGTSIAMRGADRQTLS